MPRTVRPGPAAPPRKRARSRTAKVAPERVAEIFRRLAAADPEPKGELEYINPFTLLVAVVLSAQATDAGVNAATRDLFATVTTPQQMLDLGEEGLKRHIRTIGLFNTKAKNVIALSKALVDHHGGEVPADRDAGQGFQRLALVRHRSAVVGEQRP